MYSVYQHWDPLQVCLVGRSYPPEFYSWITDTTTSACFEKLAQETVFDVNILIVDPKNIIVSSHNDQVESACARHGIAVHVVPFRHRYFWAAGTHYITNDLNRQGFQQNFFPQRQ